MAKSHNQKAKILFLERILRETGEKRAVSMQEILAVLMEHGIRAERKSIYDDMETLREFGMDIQFRRARPSGYYLAGNTAEAVSGVKEEGQSTETEEATAVDEAAAAEETAEAATTAGEAGCLHPEETDAEILQQTGEETFGAPDSESTVPSPVWEAKKPDAVSDKKPLRLLCKKEREEEIRAYFGEYAEYKEKEPGYLTVITPAMEDAQFYGWLTAMGKDVHIAKPKKAAAAYRDYLKILAKEYKGI